MAETLEISMQGTPNPNAAKFTLNRMVAVQGTTYRLPAAPAAGGAQAGATESGEPGWARELLRIAGVTQVFALNNFISVNKAPEADWNTIGPQVERVLRKAFSAAGV
jgi:hypothetical protein